MPGNAGMSRRLKASVPSLRMGRVRMDEYYDPWAKTADAVLPMPDGDGISSLLGLVRVCSFLPAERPVVFD